MAKRTTKPNCTKGFACGFSCQKIGRSCRFNIKKDSTPLIDSYTENIKKEIAPSDLKEIGSGAFGKAFVTDDVPPKVRKVGEVLQNEIDAITELNKVGVGPKILGGTPESEPLKKDGEILMELAPGKTLFSQIKEDPEFLLKNPKVQEELENQSRTMALAGWAHNDLHLKNIMYDIETETLTIIDFGLARKDRESAIREFANGGDFFTMELLDTKEGMDLFNARSRIVNRGLLGGNATDEEMIAELDKIPLKNHKFKPIDLDDLEANYYSY
jgi:serine/threonine protein kinase